VWEDRIGGSPAEVPPEPPSFEVTLLAVGDINLGRKAGKIILDGDIDYAFSETKDIIAGADIAFANLESTISDQGGVTRRGVWRFTAPPAAAESLKNAGFDIVSLANNHVWDFGEDALHETRDHLDRVGIKYAGTGADLDTAYAPAILEVNGLSIAFFAVTTIFNYGEYPDHAAFDFLAWADVDRLKAEIETVKNQVDIVVVSAHWDWEYKDYPHEDTVELAHAIADCGVDIILGHHPHVPQGIEIYGDTFIVYSLGNFAFHQTTKHSVWKTMGAILTLTVDTEGVQAFKMIPITCGFQPRVAEGELGERILSHILEISFLPAFEEGILEAEINAGEEAPGVDSP
jgi:poly-gamma-glutamate synthesis protein (capsule biosynthesis protein)